MTFLETVVLGIVQGLTEFLPVSSSGHLILVPAALGWSPPGLAFTVAAHVGTLLAVVVYFREDLRRLIVGTARWFVSRGRNGNDEFGLVLALALGTIPAAIVGLALESSVEEMFNSVTLAGAALAATAVVLLVAESLHRADNNTAQVAWWQAAIIGCAQAAAVIPGLSRSGMTIAAGLLCGLPRQLAARFAFLLSVPIIAGAGAKEALNIASSNVPPSEWGWLPLGAAVSAVAGLAAIAVVLRAVQSRGLRWFALYCALVAAAAVSITG
ncbi:MAG: undecaprenyl-diphosphate phosphatase [Armatimonadetes bacterium]|nr:undecaprenyl-diphosphate phosphatase [Armatimonadota bacterium]